MISFGIFWFFITLSMSSSIIPINDVINEYRLYLPSIGFFIFAVYGISASLQSLSPAKIPICRKVVTFLSAMVVCLLALTTVSRNRVWQDVLVFWQDVIQKSPGKIRPAQILSAEYLSRSMHEEAVATLQNLEALNPRLGKPHFLLGSMYLKLGRFDESVDEFKKAQAVRNDKAEVYVQTS